MADGILRGHPEAPSLLVQVPGLFAKAVEVIQLPVHLRIVGDASQLILLKRPLPEILIEKLPGLCIEQHKGERVLSHLKAEGPGVKDEPVSHILAGNIQGCYPSSLSFKQRVQPVLPGRRHQRIGCLRKGAGKGHPDPDDVLAEKYDHQIRRIRMDPISIFRLLQFLKLSYQHFSPPVTGHQSGIYCALSVSYLCQKNRSRPFWAGSGSMCVYHQK